MADVKGLVNDPAFQSLSPADQRSALAGVTGDKSFASLGDDETKQFVSHLRSPMPTPDSHMAANTGAVPWLQRAENDARYGSDSTGMGKFLRMIGMQATNSGVPEGVGEDRGGQVIGPLRMAEGVADMPQHPGRGIKTFASGALQTVGPALNFIAPEAGPIKGAVAKGAARVGEVAEGAGDLNNLFAKMLRYPASARQSQLGRPGTVKNMLPSFLQKYTIPESIIPKGDLGTATNPGPFAEIRMRVPKFLQDLDNAAAYQGDEGATAARSFPRPLRPLVGSPEEFAAYDQQMKLLKGEASDAGTYSAARGKVNKKLDYQQRIGKKINP